MKTVVGLPELQIRIQSNNSMISILIVQIYLLLCLVIELPKQKTNFEQDCKYIQYWYHI
jgi:hypothetical protein